MGDLLKSLPFEAWVAHVFDHEVRDPQWHFDLDAPVWAGPAGVTLAYVTRLFSEPVRHLEDYTDAQLNQGFWYLVSNSGSDHMLALTDNSAPLAARVRCIESFTPLFQSLFAVRCSSDLSHLDPPEPNPLNLACYMWWDILPLAGAPHDPARRQVDAAALSAMEDILALDSLACQESALHGLGHWQSAYPGRVGDIVGQALNSQPAWPAALAAYARHAANGSVL